MIDTVALLMGMLGPDVDRLFFLQILTLFTSHLTALKLA